MRQGSIEMNDILCNVSLEFQVNNNSYLESNAFAKVIVDKHEETLICPITMMFPFFPVICTVQVQTISNQDK